MELQKIRDLYSTLEAYKKAYPDESESVHAAWLEVGSKLDDIDPAFH